MKKQVLSTISVVVLSATLSGCIGQMGVSRSLLDVNVDIVDNRFARAGIFILASPIYGIGVAADLLIFNSIEFWSGKNPITNEASLAKLSAAKLQQINAQLQHHLVATSETIIAAELTQLNNNDLEMHISYADGSSKKLRVEQEKELIHFYLDNELISTSRLADLQAYVANNA